MCIRDRPEATRQPLLDALQQNRFAVDAKLAYFEQDGTWQAAEGDAAPQNSQFIPDFTSDDVGTDGSFVEVAPTDEADGFAALNLNPSLLQAVQALGLSLIHI